MASNAAAEDTTDGPGAGDGQTAHRNNDKTYSCGELLLKSVLVVLIMFAVLACMVVSTISTLVLAKDNTTIANGTFVTNYSGSLVPLSDASTVALWLVLFVPSAFGFTRAMVKEGLSSGQPSPHWTSVFLTAFVSVCEVSGLWLFTFYVLPDDSVDISTAIVVMNTVLVGHFIPRHTKHWWLVLNVLGILCIIGGVVWQCYDYYQNPKKESSFGYSIWAIPTSVVLLTIAWCPLLQERQMKVKSSSFRQQHHHGSQEVSERDESYQRQDTSSAAQEDTETADVRATIVKNFLNMVILVMTLFVAPPHGHNVYNGFNSIYLRQTEVMLSVLPAFGGYVLGVIACAMCIQAYSFLFPLSVAPFITFIIMDRPDYCLWFENICSRVHVRSDARVYLRLGLVLLGQICCSVYNYVLTAPKIYENESNLFWFRHYTGLFTGQHMLLNRTKAPEHPTRQSPGATDLHGLVMICTTMYRETWDEMSQYLESIEKVATSQKLGEEYNWTGKFEAHVYFDNGVRGNKLTDFSAQLVCLVQSRYKECTVEIKKTWYGWTLQWRLPGSLQLPLYIHLKDNQEVKSKKRWSQVMYMESAVDRFDDSEVKYILATDGDVDFDADSIVAMLMQMLSDRQEEVGAVCARTHPEGSGPFVWYQMFDYAIGHWLQKVTNHVLGSVLCAPGCFSVYRVKAIASVLEEYRSDVEEASEFLTKDMGEDRWFTTLLVKAGWKVNYCAGACDSTHCPEEFDEFWKQRRRWIPSTLANQILLLKNWKTINQNNKYISMIFLLFQIVLLLSTVISPSTCILIVTGGLYYGVGVPTWLSFVLFVLLTLVFALICMYYSQETQLKVAKILCFVFLIAMAIAVVGTASQMAISNTSSAPRIANDNGKYKGCYQEYSNSGDLLLPNAVTRIKDLTNAKCMSHCHENNFYYSGTGSPGTACFCGPRQALENATRLQENMCASPCPGDSGETCGGRPNQMSVYEINRLFGVQLPVDVTTLYIAIVAGIHIVAALLHPRTREAKSQKEQSKESFLDDVVAKMRQCWSFCRRSYHKLDESIEEEPEREAMEDEVDGRFDVGDSMSSGSRGHMRSIPGEAQPDPGKRFKSTRQWLQSIFGALSNKVEIYEPMFTREGYTDTSFIAGMSDEDLKDIGVADLHDRNDFRRHIRKLHQDEPDIDIRVPDNVETWLTMISLDTDEYKEKFRRAFPEGTKAQIVFQELKTMTEDRIVHKLGVQAKGHLRRLKLAITRIRQPTLREERILKAKRDIDGKFQEHPPDVIAHSKKPYLDPTTEQFRLDQNKEDEFKQNLQQLRNSYLLTYLVANSVWLVLMFTLVEHAELQVINTNPLGLVFLVTFTFVLGVQFAALVIHRLATFIQYVSRIPMTRERISAMCLNINRGYDPI
ncbi:uncharacterized protein LOC144915027 isoform X2 [Branchiostoma floridae x Branchiostoma belcheri]